jgi:hypothetical protein
VRAGIFLIGRDFFKRFYGNYPWIDFPEKTLSGSEIKIGSLSLKRLQFQNRDPILK